MSAAPLALNLTATAANLQWLVVIRLIVSLGLAVALSVPWGQAAPLLQSPAHVFCLVSYSSLAALTWLRLRFNWPVTDLEYFLHLLADIAIISTLLYFSGGATNPFVSYFLVPLTISAAILPWRFTWAIAACSIASYSLMLAYYQPLPSDGHAHHGDNSFNLHVLGMWFNFALSALLITYFVVKMANTLRRQEQVIASRREDDLRDEQILAVATLAAGTAHELGTPLATINMLVDELVAQYPNDEELSDDLVLLQQQVANCRGILQKLVNTARQHSSSATSPIDAKDYIHQVIERWQVLRPDARYRLHLPNTAAPILDVDSTLEQAITNLLNNAADASPSRVEIDVDWSDRRLRLSVRDHGSGIALDIAKQLGKPFVTAKGKGLGLGLFLSHATIARYGGSIELYNHPEGGTLAKLTLPLPCRWQPTPRKNR